MHGLKRLLAEDRANSVVEYGLLLGLLSVLLIVSISGLREAFWSMVGRIVECFGFAASGRGC